MPKTGEEKAFCTMDFTSINLLPLFRGTFELNFAKTQPPTILFADGKHNLSKLGVCVKEKAVGTLSCREKKWTRLEKRSNVVQENQL
ncbi:hypothetical protein ANN_21367 [Periplaneta americana]|uniref:Uncharacterized protein n=1 Tax=Periplaneta americana TaxID=6978 RepID=A0ABQ8SF69_PERAM|nr:hypothetical protein ANN_21367 [Periplaneta americana]